jgi:sulfatase modifying factor 1
MKRTFKTMFIVAIITIMGATAGQTADGVPNFIDTVTGNEFIFVKGGCFQMGDTFGDGFGWEKPVHEVCVEDFYMAKYEVTQGQWTKVMGSNPSYYSGMFNNCGDDCPVEQVSWNEIQKFLSKLNSQTGKNYRLPTEAQWEYAARSGGKPEKWAGTSDEALLGDYAWYSGNAGGKTHPVGKKKPNGLGLYDMSGNVFEWCSDWYGEWYYNEIPRDNPIGPGRGDYRVLRGGAWGSGQKNIRTALRIGFVPGNKNSFYGFRLSAPAR